MKNNALPSLKQRALLAYIDGFIAENKYAPSYREVMRALEYKSVSTVAKHIDGLIARGWLVKRDNSARSVEVVYKAGQPELKSPAPSLSISHEEWLTDTVARMLAGSGITEDDRVAVKRTLTLLSLTPPEER